MATYFFGSVIKVGAAVSASGTQVANGSTTIYTNPANTYAILNANVISGSGTHLAVGGQQVTKTATEFNGVIYVGPGQSVSLVSTAGTISANLSGVRLDNNP